MPRLDVEGACSRPGIRRGAGDKTSGCDIEILGISSMKSIQNETIGTVSRLPISILGVRFDNVSTQETLSLIEQMIATRKPHYAVTANVDFVVQAQHDVELRRIFFDAHLVLCDGTPLVWASRVLGNPLKERVAGADVVPL